MSDDGRNGADSTLIVALACGQPVRQAAETAAVSERTVYRRLQDEAFRASLARERARFVEEAIGRLALGMTTAADTLAGIAADSKAPAKALEQLEGMLDSKNQQVAFRAITVYLGRALGKAALPTQGGRHDLTRSEAVAIAREEHALKIDAEVPAAREMVARLVERRAQEIAAGKGTADRLIPHDLSE